LQVLGHEGLRRDEQEHTLVAMHVECGGCPGGPCRGGLSFRESYDFVKSMSYIMKDDLADWALFSILGLLISN
jgi:hypothetical protein